MERDEVDHVLIIDDDDDLRPVLERTLRRLGHAVESAADGEAGLQAAIANPPSVILADIQMPKMDGHTFLRRLNNQDHDAAVVVMSAQGTMDDVIDAVRNGAVDYLNKPWTPSELVAAVGRAAEIAEARRSVRRLQQQLGKPGEPAAGWRISSPGSSAAPPATPGGSAAPMTPAPSAATSGPAPIKPSGDEAFALLIGQLERGELSLPAMPAVLMELRELLSSRDAGLENVVSLIERDPRAAAMVVKLANTTQYSGMSRVSDMRSAVNRVGFRQIESIVETEFAQSCFPITDPRFRPLQSKIRKYALARAVAMRALAGLAGPSSGLNAGTAYLAGLLSDAGATFLLWMAAEREKTSPSAQLSETLIDCLGAIRVHHQQTGAALLRRWPLDPVIAEIAATHHLEEPSTPSIYWSLSTLAAEVANQLAPGDDITRVHSPNTALIERCGNQLHISVGSLKRTFTKLGHEIDSILETLY